jgi:ADP-L-glycero-D-manno-heptose 6-epimerase
MIVLTGAAGFIGSVVLGYLNQKGLYDIILVDSPRAPLRNLGGKYYWDIKTYDTPLTEFKSVQAVIHIGANADTLEKDQGSIDRTNITSTRQWNQFCKERQIPFIFTSTAAVYGNGQGPLNLYANSKLISEQEIDAVILRLFNVYGPNEYHKGRMASTPYHWFNQLYAGKKLQLFENSSEYKRDFVWVEDVAKTVYHFLNNYQPGVYDLGAGISCSFEGIADTMIRSLGFGEKEYIPMPKDLAAQYQKNTCADVTQLIKAGVAVNDFLAPWEGIPEYLNYLKTQRLY